MISPLLLRHHPLATTSPPKIDPHVVRALKGPQVPERSLCPPLLLLSFLSSQRQQKTSGRLSRTDDTVW
ncbi:unnamed protein product [Lota lota]